MIRRSRHGPLQPIEALLRFHLAGLDHARLGSGPDEYHPHPLEHPAAVAFYARGLSRLAKWTGRDDDAALARNCGERLMRISAASHLPSWGLRFEWRQLGADTPATFTTAVAALALAELHDLDPPRPLGIDTLHGACRWLVEEVPWREFEDGAGPWYAPGWDFVATNIVSLTAAALLRGYEITGEQVFRARGEDALRLVVAAQEPEGYWPYADPDADSVAERQAGRVVDAVHSAYTIDGLLTAVATSLADRRCQDGAVRGVEFILSELVAPDGEVREKVMVIPGDDPDAQRLRANRIEHHVLDGERQLFRFPEETRLQGFGAVLNTVQGAVNLNLAPGEALDRVARYALKNLAVSPTGRFRFRSGDGRNFPRHEAQFFDGLAALVSSGAAPIHPKALVA